MDLLVPMGIFGFLLLLRRINLFSSEGFEIMIG